MAAILRLAGGLDRSHNHGRSLPVIQILQQPQPGTEDFVVQHTFASVAFPGGKLLDPGLSKQGQVVTEVVDIAGVGEHHHQSRGTTSSECGGDQQCELDAAQLTGLLHQIQPIAIVMIRF